MVVWEPIIEFLAGFRTVFVIPIAGFLIWVTYRRLIAGGSASITKRAESETGYLAVRVGGVPLVAVALAALAAVTWPLVRDSMAVQIGFGLILLGHYVVGRDQVRV